MFRLKLIVILTAALFLGKALFATTYAVGTCKPALHSYPTISMAVSSVPSGSTIDVCPGNYPEQVLITQPLSLTGISSGEGNAAAVVSPAGGVLTQCSTDQTGMPACYQILVQNTTSPVKISNLIVDGTGASTPQGYVVGIYYQNASGSITNAVVRNQTCYGSAVGIYADGNGAPPTFTVENSSVHGQDWFGISIAGFAFSSPFNPTITGNTTDGSNARDGIFFGWSGGTVKSNRVNNGLQLYASTATVSDNTLSSLVMQVDSSTITGNIIANGVLFAGGGANLEGNKIDGGGGIGVTLYNDGDLGPGKVQSNTIVNSSTAVYGCAGVSPVTGYTVSRNSIMDANVGVQMSSGNTITANKYFATVTEAATCP